MADPEESNRPEEASNDAAGAGSPANESVVSGSIETTVGDAEYVGEAKASPETVKEEARQEADEEDKKKEDLEGTALESEAAGQPVEGSSSPPPVPEKDDLLAGPDSVDNEVVEFPEKTGDSVTSTTPSNASTPTLTPSDSTTHIKRSRRTPSIALSISSTTSGQQTVSSMVFVKKALEKIAASKDARKNASLDTAVKKALKQLNENPSLLPSPNAIFEPLRLVCTQSNNNELKENALDCIGKLFTFSYLEDPEPPKVDPESGVTPPPTVSMVEKAVSTVCDTFNGESTDPRVELQIVKALLAAVLNDDLVAHGSTLLKAIRQTYTVFVLSRSGGNQGVAQASLTQMVNAVFDRVKKYASLYGTYNGSRSFNSSSVNIAEVAASRETGSKEQLAQEAEESGSLGSREKLTLQDMENRGERRSIDDEKRTNVLDEYSDKDLAVKDAFLVFRTMCKLSEKALEGDGSDTKSHAMRSKLLSLHLLHTILKSHMNVFMSKNIIIRSNTKGEERFVVAVRDYISSTLARNAASISPPVFEISAEIFWLLLCNLRNVFKREIEVFFAEIYLPIMEMKTSTAHQKQYFLTIIQKICNDPRALVELFLNYDCDSKATINLYEKIINVLVKLMGQHVEISHVQLQHYHDARHKSIAVYNLSLPPALSIANVTASFHHPEQHLFPPEYALKISALESLVAALRSLLTWSQRGIAVPAVNGATAVTLEAIAAEGERHTEADSGNAEEVTNGRGGDDSMLGLDTTGVNTPIDGGQIVDDPQQFETLKDRKSMRANDIRQFNFKPKRGLKKLFDDGFIEDDRPETLAAFFLATEEIDKAVLGEYLGGDDERNIAVMHAFVDLIDFANLGFVAAIRRFLQAFRLPGEAQKIDRLMLKFAQRYFSQNPGVFADADAAYYLAYSVIILNTDLHSPSIKDDRRMSPADFLKVNAKKNGENDFPEEFLLNIFNEILSDEIKLHSEQHAALLASDGKKGAGGFAATFGFALSTMGRDQQKEAYMKASREMANKTEQLFRDMVGRRGGHQSSTSTDLVNSESGTFYIASQIEHVKPMFKVVWMSLMAGLSNLFHESDEPEIISLCLEGMKLSIKISCLFDIYLPRVSFMGTVQKYTNLKSLTEMRPKNVEAIRVLLDTALSEGNMLGETWKNVLTSCSQLERFRLINSGISSQEIPDVSQIRVTPRASMESSRSSFYSRSARSTHVDHRPVFDPRVVEAIQSSEFQVKSDKIFSQTAQLSGTAVVEFVRALTEVSIEEIQSSGDSQNPRTDALQKMVDVCYYNMGRIRLEWSQIWQTMGEQFNVVCLSTNQRVVQFALDALRQMSYRFFDIDELAHFKFQKDFLQPFEYVMENNKDPAAKELALDCVHQMVMAKSDRIKSGWSRIFGVLSAAARIPNGHIVSKAFELCKMIHRDHLMQVIQQDAFPDLANCLAELAKNPQFQKIGLHAIELLKDTIPRIIKISQQPVHEGSENALRDALWYSTLRAFHGVIMNGDELEVRSRALNYLFDALTEYGGTFETQSWDAICNDLLFPIFKDLGSKPLDELTVWQSTTMVQALRNVIALLTFYFDTLERMLDQFLDLLVRCIDQENETVSKIGSSCLEQLVRQNINKLGPEHWKKIVDTIDLLFRQTTPNELFDMAPRGDGDEDADEQEKYSRHERSASIASVGLSDQPPIANGNGSSEHNVNVGYDMRQTSLPSPNIDTNMDRQKKFRRTIIKAVLQKLMITTVSDLISEPEVFATMPTSEMIRIGRMLRTSYSFASAFNNDVNLRIRLYKQGFMKQTPNLLKQESTSSLTYIRLMMRLFKDDSKFVKESEIRLREELAGELIPQCVDILRGYNRLQDKEQRHINALWPVILVILDEYYGFSDEQFKSTIGQFYPQIVGLLSKDMVEDVRDSMKLVLDRAGELVII